MPAEIVKTSCNRKTLPDLKQMCKDKGVTGFTSMKKNEIAVKCCERFSEKDMSEKLAVIKKFVSSNVKTAGGIEYNGIKYQHPYTLDNKFSSEVTVLIDYPREYRHPDEYGKNFEESDEFAAMERADDENGMMVDKLRKMFPSVSFVEAGDVFGPGIKEA
jgi:hypothetical protein